MIAQGAKALRWIVAPGKLPISRAAQDEADADADIMPDELVEPKRIESADERAGHREDLDDRERQRIADQHIGAQFVEIIGHEGGARRRRAKGREDQCRRPMAELLTEHCQPRLRGRGDCRRRKARTRVAASRGEGDTRLIDGDERRDRGERELEARIEDRFRLDHDDERSRQGKIAHAERLSLDQDRGEHDRGHDQRPFGANARASKNIVEDAPTIAAAAAHFLIGQRSASVGLKAKRRRSPMKKMPATSVICTPEIVMM
jgi:hypothetical protein